MGGGGGGGGGKLFKHFPVELMNRVGVLLSNK